LRPGVADIAIGSSSSMLLRSTKSREQDCRDHCAPFHSIYLGCICYRCLVYHNHTAGDICMEFGTVDAAFEVHKKAGTRLLRCYAAPLL
jgi:hypothetical protein